MKHNALLVLPIAAMAILMTACGTRNDRYNENNRSVRIPETTRPAQTTVVTDRRGVGAAVGDAVSDVVDDGIDLASDVIEGGRDIVSEAADDIERAVTDIDDGNDGTTDGDYRTNHKGKVK